jgi:hypothetical protein
MKTVLSLLGQKYISCFINANKREGFMENTHLVFYPEASEFSKNTYEFEKMGIRLAGCIDEVRWKYRYNALDV